MCYVCPTQFSAQRSCFTSYNRFIKAKKFGRRSPNITRSTRYETSRLILNPKSTTMLNVSSQYATLNKTNPVHTFTEYTTINIVIFLLWFHFPRVLSLPCISTYCNFVRVFFISLKHSAYPPRLFLHDYQPSSHNETLHCTHIPVLTFCFSSDVTVCSFPFRVACTVKHRVSGRDRNRGIDGSENSKTI